MRDKQVNVINKCYSKVNPAVLKSVTSWGKEQNTEKFKTFFLDRLSGKFLGEYPPYDDPENPNNITFPLLKITLIDNNNKKIICNGINLRSIYNGQTPVRSPDAKPTENVYIEYPNHFKDGNVNNETVSGSIVFLGNDYQSSFEKIISTQERGEIKEQSAVIIYHEKDNTITCVALPDTINRVGLNEDSLKATADALAALTIGKELNKKRVYTQLLPNGPIEVFREYFEDPDIPEVNYKKVKEIVENLPDFLSKDLWGLAMFKYIVSEGRYKYYNIDIKKYDNYISTISNIQNHLERIAFDYRMHIITNSHTHPYVTQKKKMNNAGSFVYERTSSSLFSTISKLDHDTAVSSGLPDLIITFMGLGFIKIEDKDGSISHISRQKVEKFEVLYKDTGQKRGKGDNVVYDAKLITKSQSKFYSNKESILFEYFVTKYYD